MTAAVQRITTLPQSHITQPVSRDFLQSKFFKATRAIQNNTILSRAVIELLGADLPSSLTELIGRNWKTAAEVAFRITLFTITSLFIPLLFIPVLNKFAAKKFNLPTIFKRHFLNQFEDLIPEKKDPKANEEFKQKLIQQEGKQSVDAFLKDASDPNRKINEYKDLLVKAKADVMQKDILYSGLLTYMVPWVQVWFAKKILGVVGYTGELDLLDESQREASTRFHEKTKYFKFALGFVSTIFGSNWYSKKVYTAATKTNNEIKDSIFLKFIKKHIKQFDYYKEIYVNRLNLAGTFLFGADFGFLLAVRSLNEFLERIFRLIVFWPTMFWGVEWVNSKFAQHSDKKYGTILIDSSRLAEFGIKKTKTLGELEQELNTAQKENNATKQQQLLKSMKAQQKFYWLSILIDSLLMGVGLTAANIAGTNMRVANDIW